MHVCDWCMDVLVVCVYIFINIYYLPNNSDLPGVSMDVPKTLTLTPLIPGWVNG